MKKILIVVDSINIEDSSGSKANVALIHNLAESGFEVMVYHYTLKNIHLQRVQCYAIPEIKFSPLYFLSRIQRVFSRKLNWNLMPFLENRFGFSFTFFNDTNSIVKALKQLEFQPDLVITLSKGASFRPHYSLLKMHEWHCKWLAYVHDPYPFHFYPNPYKWFEPGSQFKEDFFRSVSQKAMYSGFPSQLLKEWMGSYFPNFLKTGVVIPHQNAKFDSNGSDLNLSLPNYFNPSKFNLLHAGNLLKQRSPEGLIEGYKLFLKNNQEARKEAQLILLGKASDHSQMLKAYQKNSPEIYIYNGNVSFNEVFQLQKQVSVNIILESKSEISPFLPGKFTHCVEANSIILSLAPYKSEVRRLLGDSYEYWAEADDVEKIAELIEKLYQLWKQSTDNLLLNRKDLEEYLSINYLQSVLNGLNVKDMK